MAFAKRPASEQQDIDDNATNNEAGAAQSTIKRRRTDHRSHSTSNVSPPTNGDADEVIAFDDVGLPEYGSDDGIDSDAEEQWFNKTFKSSRNQVNVAAEHGVIEEVFCMNFMCHTKLRVTLGPLINFIIGHNGSGKSAVLTALTLCLGAKATVTNRGTSLKSFIKQGEHEALLRVKIKNQGMLAYKPDLYGESIIVERRFTMSGTSDFRLKSADQRVVSSKRHDLEDMLDYLSLQLDNPMNVLSQDLARQFLSNSTPRDKYSSFQRGTQLDQLDRDYHVIEDRVDQTEIKIEEREPDVEALKTRTDDLERRKKLIEKNQSMRDAVKHYQVMYVWAQIEIIERDLARETERVEAAIEEIAKAEQAGKEKSDEYDRLHDTNERSSTTTAEVKEAVQAASVSHDEVKGRFEAGKTQLVENKTNQRRIKEDLDAAQKEIEKAKQSIESEQARIAAENGPAQAKRLADLDALGQRKVQCQATIDAFELRSFEDAKREAQRTVQTKEQLLQPKEASLSNAEAMLGKLKSNTATTWDAYPSGMHNLLRMIDKETGWSQKPVGPIGMKVRLKQPEWASILERSFGAILESFVVANEADKNRLVECQRRAACATTINIGSFQRINVQKTPDPSLTTIMKVLEIEGDAVRNLLIIQQNIDNTVLMTDRQAGFDLMENQSARNQSIRATITKHDTKRGWGIRFAKGSSGPVKAWEGRTRLQIDKEDEIKAQQTVVDGYKEELREAQREVQNAKDQLRSASEAYTEALRQSKQLRIAHQTAEEQIDDLQRQIEADKVDAGQLDIYQEQLKEAEDAKHQHENTYQEQIDAKDQIDKSQTAIKLEMDGTNRALQEAQAKLKKAEARAYKTSEDRRKALTEKNAALEAIETARARKEKAEELRDKYQHEVDDNTAQATAYHSRVKVDEGLTPEDIKMKMTRHAEEVKRSERSVGGTRKEINEQWAEASKIYTDAKEDLGRVTRAIEYLKKTLHHRKNNGKALKRFITLRASFTFQWLLQERAFRGKLMVNHQEKAMDISVEPDITRGSAKGRQTKTLSGGEKSFSTICLLLSIWEAMGSPIRCLDEFDVFMDNVNRDISMRMMIQAAREGSASRQFIFITPQAMGGVRLDNDVRIHKMSDPERGQTALPYGET